MKTDRAVGIDDLNIYAGTLSIDYAEIAEARDFAPQALQSARFIRRSLPPAYEDSVTLAVNAARPLVDEFGPDAFDLLIVATETGVDYAKPLSSYIHRYLELKPACRNFEIKHASYAGTAALQMAAAWAAMQVAPDKRALVITTDIGRRHFHSLAELSTGAGAVAMVVSLQPRLFELEPRSGYVAAETFDTARPTATAGWSDPPLSLGTYLDLLEAAWRAYRSRDGAADITYDFDYMLYHTPLVSLVERAHRLLLEEEAGPLSDGDFEENFRKMVVPSLRYNEQLGNTYSGTLYTALAAVIDALPAGTRARAGCFSYGAGACAELFAGRICPEASTILARRAIADHLTARRGIDIRTYEATVLAVEQSLSARSFDPRWDQPAGHYEQAYEGRGRLVLDRVNNYYRTYRWS